MGSLAQKRLTELLKGLVHIPAGLDCWVADIQQDSRKITQGALFFAAEGVGSDGKDYIQDAIARGAIAVVKPGRHAEVYEIQSVVMIELDQVRPHVGEIAHRFFGQVTKSMQVIGVTGTNGKSSVTHFIAQLAELLGSKSAVIGTLGYGSPGNLLTTTHTTPDAITLHRCLAKLYAQNYRLIALEVSSHALDQCRVQGIEFNCGVFTNLSRDHLDYHRTMDNYAEAKKKLFQSSAVQPILNLEDDTGRRWSEEMTARNYVGFAVNNSSDVHDDCKNDCSKNVNGPHVWAEKVDYHAGGIAFRLCNKEYCVNAQTQLLGAFNLENLLAAVAALVGLGHDLRQVGKYLSRLVPVAGRMEVLTVDTASPKVIIDYAHTPHALGAVLSTLRKICEGQLWCVFGCGGDRDKGKRALMGSAAESGADHIILTDDNPRSEAPERILADILQGMNDPDKVRIIQPREKAIASALELAKVGDMILVAGKGHEKYQEIDGVKHPYSDYDIVTIAQATNIAPNDMPLDIAGGWQ